MTISSEAPLPTKISSSVTPLICLLLGVVHDRLARREDAFGIRITRRIRQIADHVLLDFFRRIEAERGQIADVQLDDLVAFFLHLLGLLQHGAADVVADVGQLGGLLDIVSWESIGAVNRRGHQPERYQKV
jgi:hypothetical protein